jgi:hypothetical protein
MVPLAVIVIAATAFIWDQSRMEIVYLCGNFTPGVTKQSVTRQLDTGQFLRYRNEQLSGGSSITSDSAFTLGVYRCVIEFDTNDRVLIARVD